MRERERYIPHPIILLQGPANLLFLLFYPPDCAPLPWTWRSQTHMVSAAVPSLCVEGPSFPFPPPEFKWEGTRQTS